MKIRSNKNTANDIGMDNSIPEFMFRIENELEEPHYECIFDLIYDVAEKFPTKIALAGKQSSITYAELILEIEQIASFLYEYGITPGDIVAIHGKKSITLFITFLAVLRIGAILMPISEDLPEVRKQMMVKQVKSNWAIHFEEKYIDYFSDCQNILLKEVPKAPLYKSEDFSKEIFSTSSAKGIFPKIDGNSPAYIFFTSGSTFEPKAIMGIHKSITQFVVWQKQEFKLNQSLKILQLASISFDAVLRDLFLPLISGGELFIPEIEAVQDPSTLMNVIEQEKITLIHTIPSIIANWLKIHTCVNFKYLQYLILSGEPLLGNLVLKWRQKFPECKAKIVNFYGPTETTMIKTFYIVPNEIFFQVQPCGKPISTTEIYIFDENNIVLNANQKGEIIIRTPFRTLGYLGSSQKDNKGKFFVNPYRQDPNDILYRTGDLGYITEESVLIIDGRKDDEVKINGIRINPLEVTSVLSLNPKISICIVLSSKNERDDIVLIAAIVLKLGEQASSEYFRSYLKDKLPLAMIPSTFEFFESLPMLNNGKIDKNTILKNIRKIKDIENKRQLTVDKNLSTDMISDIEHTVIFLWNELLDIDGFDLNANNNFFEMGGNSIKAMLLLTKIRQLYPIELSLREFLENPTVEKIAEKIRENLAVDSEEESNQQEAMKWHNQNHDLHRVSSINNRLEMNNSSANNLTAKNLNKSTNQLSGSLTQVQIQDKLKEEVKMNTDSWVHMFSSNPQAKIRIICFHYSGGNAYVFNDFAKLLPPSFELFSIQLPGRMNLLDIPPYQKIDDLLKPLSKQLLSCLAVKPFVFLGHSLGGLIAYCLAHHLREHHDLLPQAIIVSACTAPSLRNGGQLMHQMPQQEFIEKLLSYNKDHNEIPINLFENADLMNLMLPILRADFSLAETYQYIYREPLGCPIISYGAKGDPQVSIEEVKAWEQETSQQFIFREFEGSHFFIKTHQTQFVNALATDLSKIVTIY